MEELAAEIRNRGKELIDLIQNENTKRDSNRPPHIIEEDCIKTTESFIRDVLKDRGMNWWERGVRVERITPTIKELLSYGYSARPEIIFSTNRENEDNEMVLDDSFYKDKKIAYPITIRSRIKCRLPEMDYQILNTVGSQYMKLFPNIFFKLLKEVEMSRELLFSASEVLTRIWGINMEKILSAMFVGYLGGFYKEGEKIYKYQIDSKNAENIWLGRLKNELDELGGLYKALELEIKKIEYVPEYERTETQNRLLNYLYGERMDIKKLIDKKNIWMEIANEGVKLHSIVAIHNYYKYNVEHSAEFRVVPEMDKEIFLYMTSYE